MRDRKNTDNLLKKWHWFVSFIWGQASTVDVVFYSPLALLCVFVYQRLRKRISRTIRTDLFHRDVQGINSLNLSVKIASLTLIWLPFIKILLDFHWISLRLHNTNENNKKKQIGNRFNKLAHQWYSLITHYNIVRGRWFHLIHIVHVHIHSKA